MFVVQTNHSTFYTDATKERLLKWMKEYCKEYIQNGGTLSAAIFTWKPVNFKHHATKHPWK